MIQEAIAKLLVHQDLDRAEMVTVMGEIADGGATPAQVGGFLAALRSKGETVDEVAGAAEVMRARVDPVRVKAGIEAHLLPGLTASRLSSRFPAERRHGRETATHWATSTSADARRRLPACIS